MLFVRGSFRPVRLSRLTLLIAVVFSSPIKADPESHYLIHCMGCHLTDGQGQPPEVPAFGEDTLKMAMTPAGRAYLIQVPGSSQAPLTDAELAAVLNWLLDEFTSKGKFDKLTPEEVSHYRKTTLTNPAEIRSKLLAQSLSP